MPARGQVTYTPDELEQLIDEYFAKCANEEVMAVVGKTKITLPRMPTIEGLALHLGLGRATLYRWLEGEYGATTEGPGGETVPDKEAQQRVRDMLARAKDRIILDAYEGATYGRYNDRITMMRLGRMGETVKQEVDQTTTVKAVWVGVDPADAEQYSK